MHSWSVERWNVDGHLDKAIDFDAFVQRANTSRDIADREI